MKIIVSDTSIIQLLNRAAKPLADFLGENLPEVDEDWWNYLVLNSLPDYAKRNVDPENGSLYDLDIAALLKVFDANWSSLSSVKKLNYVLRNYIKEMQSIRNDWAHQTLDGIPDEKIERHLSTLYLLCKEINADEAFLSEINDARTIILSKALGVPLSPEITERKTQKEKNNPDNARSIISVGTLIRIKTNPSQQGVVMGVSTGGKEPRYNIFINNKNQQYYHSQIEAVQIREENTSVSLDEFNAYLTATQISNPNSQTLYSLNSAKIDFIPHQFRPVLKFIKSDRPRLLIADGVGVGKTIEAGLILKELEARNNAQSVLIICPKPLVTERKWQDEMKIRFGEGFTSLDGKSFRQAIIDASLDEWDMGKYGKIIVPYSLFTEDKLKKCKTFPGLLNLEIPPKFDLVIVDEAHHIRNSDTFAYEAVKFFVNNAEAAVFLTATPIQMGTQDLFTLLNLLRPDLVSDMNVFNSISEPNPYINDAISEIRGHKENWMEKTRSKLELAAKTSWGQIIYPANPVFIKVMELLAKSSLTDEERITLLTDVESLHTFSSILNRTRRRDIGEYAVRKTVTISTPFTPEQKVVYDEILNIQAEILSKINPDTPVGFMMNTIQRRAASCLPGIVPFLEDILTCHLDEYDFVESEYYNEIGNFDISPIRERINEIIKSAKKLPSDDAKYDEMLRVLREKQNQHPNKVMIFSTFRHTLTYLANKMFDDGFRVGMIHGGIKDEDRRYLRERFSLSKDDADALDVLLFSEVGCEGLDYQFCNCMINYDLPWNPMKIEQRIGRIDRTGQKSESVSIFNQITPETVDADIYERCLLRIGVFEESIGGSEEILGDITKEMHEIGDNFRLSEEEKRDRLGQLADNTIRKYVEQEKLAVEQAELFGLNLPKMQMEKEIEDATSFWLSPQSLENLIRIYFKKRFDSENEFIVGEKSSKKLRMNADHRAMLLEDFKNLPQNSGYKLWKKWLEGKDKEHSMYYPVYFDSESSLDGEGDLITPVHPLIKQAVSYLKRDEDVSTKFSVTDSEVPAGEYTFAIYLWNYSGVHQNQMIMPISENELVSEKLFDYIKNGVSESQQVVLDPDVIEKLENVHYKHWIGESEKHKRRNSEIIGYKKASLKRSYGARLANLSNQIDAARDEHIRRMKNDESKNVRGEFDKKMEELEKSESLADLTSSPIGYGIVEVR